MNINSYMTNTIVYGIEVFSKQSRQDEPDWNLHALHPTLEAAQNDLRWITPNRIVKVSIDVSRVGVVS